MGNDNYFGPHLPGTFDFTILFEQSIFSLLPTALFIIVAPFRIFHLYHHETRVKAGTLLWSKLVSQLVREEYGRALIEAIGGSGCLSLFANSIDCIVVIVFDRPNQDFHRRSCCGCG